LFMNSEIREYVEKDRSQLLECILELQEYERKFTSRKKPGKDVAESYLSFILRRRKERSGNLFISEVDGKVVGFASAWINEDSELTEYPEKYVYFSDLLVKSDYRRKGLAKKLVEKVIEFASSKEAKRIKVETLAKNKPIQELLKSFGFEQYEIAWDLNL